MLQTPVSLWVLFQKLKSPEYCNCFNFSLTFQSTDKKLNVHNDSSDDKESICWTT